MPSARIALAVIVASAALACHSSPGRAEPAGIPICTSSAAVQPHSRTPEAFRQTILDFAGPAVPIAEAAGGDRVLARYEERFRHFAEAHWRRSGHDWEKANYYDRARIYYVWWARGGSDEYLERANRLAHDYRTRYLEAANYGAATWWSMLGGVTLHFLVTGDECSRLAVGKVADNFVGPYIRDNDWANLVDPDIFDGRDQSRVLQAVLYAAIIDAPSLGVQKIQPNGEDWGVPGGNDWRAILPGLLDRLLSSQAANGSRRYKDACGRDKPFMNGLLNDALIEYHTLLHPDDRILPFIKNNIDYMWNNEWVDTGHGFKYLEVRCGSDRESGPVPAPDLNGLIVNGFGWVFSQTKDRAYRERGDAVLAGAVNRAYLASEKVFNQTYSTSYKYLAFRK